VCVCVRVCACLSVRVCDAKRELKKVAAVVRLYQKAVWVSCREHHLYGIQTAFTSYDDCL
jgi:gamma-glutamyl:cysteine ligase YbdK (ATP-grasp superfamily)